MNYRKTYFSLIEAAQRRAYGDERHHIIPRCMGGGDEESNMVALSFKEHYVAHLLLAKLYPDEPGLILAVGMMSMRAPTGAMYAVMREKFSKAASSLILDGWSRKRGFDNYLHQGHVMLMEYLEGATIEVFKKSYNVSGNSCWKSIHHAADFYNLRSRLAEERRRRKKLNSSMCRRAFTPEQENRRIHAVRSVNREEYADRLKVERRGSGNPMYGRRRVPRIVDCPHCGKSGAESQMKRWHYENCKERNENIES